MISIRRYQESDWSAIWPMLHATFAAGETYAYAPQTSEAQARHSWIEAPAATYVACADDGQVLATYYLKANQPGLGSHVCNCGFVVSPTAEGRGIASAMCEHAQREAVTMGFLAMQFNLVVATNERAVRLWKKLGFAVVGTLPGAYRHQRLGLTDALVMYKTLAAPA